jgi:hypothetical protein
MSNYCLEFKEKYDQIDPKEVGYEKISLEGVNLNY